MNEAVVRLNFRNTHYYSVQLNRETYFDVIFWRLVFTIILFTRTRYYEIIDALRGYSRETLHARKNRYIIYKLYMGLGFPSYAQYCADYSKWVTYYFAKYNFFRSFFTNSTYVYIDKIYLSIFIKAFEKSSIWDTGRIDLEKEIRNALKNNGSKYFRLARFVDLSSTTKKSVFLLDSIRALFHGSVHIVIASFYLPFSIRSRYTSIINRNEFFNTFVYPIVDIPLIDYMKHLTDFEKIWLYNRIKNIGVKKRSYTIWEE